MTELSLNQRINWDKVDGLVPAIIQHHLSGEVLMLGYMNQEALEKTLDEGKVTFFSRAKNRLWTKGETSGHFLLLKTLSLDCDQDTLLVLADPQGPTCHLNNETCFGDQGPPSPMLSSLERIIHQRALTHTKDGQASPSYTQTLLAEGIQRCAQKVGEEGVEVALAATSGDQDALCAEAADLLYHLLVTLKAADVSLNDVLQVLQTRHQSADTN